MPTMKIFYGPPGTGKTWQAAREAVLAIEPDLYRSAIDGKQPERAFRKLHDQLVSEGRILWVTFHPSYSYEDFVEGYRPIVDDKGQLAYRVVDGPFKALCLRARFQEDLQIGEQLIDGGGRPAGIVVDKDSGGWVVRVTPKRSDQVASSIDKYVPRFIVDRILASGLPLQIFSITGNGSHELAEYGIDPNDLDVPDPQSGDTTTSRSGSVIRKIVAARTGVFSSSDLTNAAHIGSVIRRLSTPKAAEHGLKNSVAIVIDEINRAEPSRVFGELLTLLEADKREGMKEEKKIWLPYSKKLFSIPANVSVIGTMNTVDRSLTALDFAMRRRFEFVRVAAQPALVPNKYGGVNLRLLLKRINDRVSMLIGSGHEFGHAYFMQEKLESIRLSMSWGKESDAELRVLAHVLEVNIFPTLAEYFHDDWLKIKAIAGETRYEIESISLFESPPKDQKFISRLPDDYEVFEGKTLIFSKWWNPGGDSWDGKRFLIFLNSLAAGN